MFGLPILRFHLVVASFVQVSGLQALGFREDAEKKLKLPKEDAIGREQSIVDDLAKLFAVLLPLYDAASSHLE